MEQETDFQMEVRVQQALNQLLTLLDQSDVIQDYKKIEAKVENHQGLNQLVEEIKVYQKEAVKAAHYGKPEAEKQAIKRADELTATFDQHPLVLRYREKLMEANDLLQHVTKLLERKVNFQLELGYEDLFNQQSKQK